MSRFITSRNEQQFMASQRKAEKALELRKSEALEKSKKRAHLKALRLEKAELDAKEKEIEKTKKKAGK